MQRLIRASEVNPEFIPNIAPFSPPTLELRVAEEEGLRFTSRILLNHHLYQQAPVAQKKNPKQIFERNPVALFIAAFNQQHNSAAN